jgi:hypothetical protein
MGNARSWSPDEHRSVVARRWGESFVPADPTAIGAFIEDDMKVDQKPATATHGILLNHCGQSLLAMALTLDCLELCDWH